MRNARFVTATLFALLLLVPAARSDDYPSHPITLIVPYPPGGGVDTIARVMSAKLSVALGQQIVIENRPGAGAVIGTRAAAKAPVDGYTLVMLATGFTLPANTGYEAKDFAPIGTISSTPIVVMAHPSLPANSLADLIALAKKDPGKLSAGTPQPIIERISKEMRAIIGTEEISKRIVSDGGDPAPMTSEEYAAMIERDEAKWAELIKKLGLVIN